MKIQFRLFLYILLCLVMLCGCTPETDPICGTWKILQIDYLPAADYVARYLPDAETFCGSIVINDGGEAYLHYNRQTVQCIWVSNADAYTITFPDESYANATLENGRLVLVMQAVGSTNMVDVVYQK